MSDESSRPRSKVARVLETYDLDDWGAKLERRWIGDGGERTSLRTLADQLNEKVLEATLQDAGHSPTRPDVESAYRTLTADEVSRGDRIRKVRELEQAGVDVETLRADFVTHQAVHTYLTDYRKVELPDGQSNTPEQAVESVQRLQGRATAVAESTLDRLTSEGTVAEHDYDLFVNVQVVCNDCGSTYEFGSLVRQGGCECAE